MEEYINNFLYLKQQLKRNSMDKKEEGVLYSKDYYLKNKKKILEKMRLEKNGKKDKSSQQIKIEKKEITIGFN